MKKIRIATRASKLALTQSNYIKSHLLALDGALDVEIVEISTKGDRDQSDFLYKSSSVGFFTSEVEKALLDNRADLAVHSFKDLPTAITPGLTIAAVPQRENVADALIAAAGISSIEDLPAASTVGTSSLRRIAQINHIRGDLNCVPLRGNVETRVGKVHAGQIDAIIIACAGLNRLGLDDKISARLDPKEFLPAPAQGALAVQIRDADTELMQIVSKLGHTQSRITADAERYTLSLLHGGCSIPLGIYSHIEAGRLTMEAMISDVPAERYIRCTSSAVVEDWQKCAADLTEELLKAGAREILNDLKND